MSVEQIGEIKIPQDADTLIAIKNGMKEVSDSKIRQKAEADLQTAIFQRLTEETKVPNAILRALATAQAEGGVDKMLQKVDAVETLYLSIAPDLQTLLSRKNQASTQAAAADKPV